MAKKIFKVLLLEENLDDVRLISALLRAARDTTYDLKHVSRLEDGLIYFTQQSRLKKSCDLVLLNLSLPDSLGLDTLFAIRQHAPEAAIVLLSDLQDEDLARQAVKAGAQDFVVKSELSTPLLVRVMRYALEKIGNQEPLPAYENHQRQQKLSQSEAETQRKNRELRLLNRVIGASMQATEIEPVLETTCSELKQAFQISRTTAMLYDPLADLFTVSAEAVSNRQSSLLGLTVTKAKQPAIYNLLTGVGSLVLSSSYEAHGQTAYSEILQQFDAVSLVILPILVNDQVWGNVILDSDEGRRFLSDEIDLAWSITDQIASVLVRLKANEERRQTELILRENEERFRQVISSISDHIYVSELTADGNHYNHYISPNVELLTGYPLQDFVADPKFWAETVIHPQDRQIAKDQLDIFRQGRNSETEYRMTRPNGDIIWVRDSGKVQSKENVILVYGVVSDITERKQIEEEIKQRAGQQAIVAELGQQALMGVDLAALMNQTVSLVAKTVNVPYCMIFSCLSQCNELLLQAAINWPKSPSGQTRIPANRDNHAAYTLSVNQAVIVEDLRTETRFHGAELLHNHDIICGASVVIHGGTNVHPYGVLVVHSDQIRVFTNDDINFLKAVANIITQTIERQQAQTALETEKSLLAQRVAERTAALSASNAELARATRLKDEFLANMSHELRTPLNAVLGMSEVLREAIYGELNSDQLRALNHIEEGGRHLLDLINDILDLSKIEAGKLELILGPVSVESVCQMSLRFVKQMAQDKQIQVTSSIDTAISSITADERRLKQVLVNLLSNAVKFTPQGGQVKLEVSGNPQQSVVTFNITDTGIGIAEEDIQQLFKPFVQLDSKLSRQHEGTGLGLSLAARLIEMHGGSISVQSTLRQGSSFTVSLPWPEVFQPAENTLSRTEGLKTELPPTRNLMVSPANFQEVIALDSTRISRVLLAEDNEANINSITPYLKANGYQITVARNGAEALQWVKEMPPDIILMDIQMPVMDGLEAIRRIRANTDHNTIPIIALTALAMPGDRQRCLDAGANAYLSKPVSLDRLVKLIERQLTQHIAPSEID